MYPDWHNVTVVTGAGRGVGSAIATKLAKAHRVLVTDLNADRAATVADDLARGGADVLSAKLNVAKKEDFLSALDLATEKWGGVGVLVNNASVTKTTPIYEISNDEFREVLGLNAGGVFAGCQVFGSAFKEQRYGRIINLSSLAGQNGGAATGAHYAASKGAIITLTKVFARDLAAHGVTVNAISPGPLEVELLPEILTPEIIDGLKKMIPVGHLGDPSFIGELVCLLASPSAASMTGATLDANGGLYVR